MRTLLNDSNQDVQLASVTVLANLAAHEVKSPIIVDIAPFYEVVALP